MKFIKHVRTEMGKRCPSAGPRGNEQSKHQLHITTTVSQAERWLIVVIWPGNHHDVWAAVISTMSPILIVIFLSLQWSWGSIFHMIDNHRSWDASGNR
jgi:hypothetical protein